MKLSMWTSYYADETPEDAVRLLKENGYDCCELSDEHAEQLLARGDAATVGEAFRGYCDGIGMQVLQGHLYLKVRLCDETTRPAEVLCDWLDLFLAIGIKSAVLHCDGKTNADLPSEIKRENNLATLRRLTDHIKGTDLVICLENLIHYVTGIDELLWFVEKLDTPNIGICLDTGHLNLSKNPDQVDFIRRAGKHLKALHVADNEGKSDQHMLPYGRGNIDFEAVVAALREIGYDRLFNYEVPGERSCPPPIRAAKLAYAKTIFEHLMR